MELYSRPQWIGSVVSYYQWGSAGVEVFSGRLLGYLVKKVRQLVTI